MSDFFSPLRFVIHPRVVAAQLAAAPRWGAAFLLLAGLTVLLQALSFPALLSATVTHLPASATPEDQRRIADFLSEEFPYRLAVLPFRLLLGWWGTACLMYACLSLVGTSRPVQLVHCFALEVHAETVGVLAGVATLLQHLVVPAGTTVADLAPPLNAAQFAGPGIDERLHLLLTSINLFTLWYVVVVGAGISVLCGVRRRKAFLVAAAVWAASTGFATTVLYLLRNAFSLPV
jgi:hypothetical protein